MVVYARHHVAAVGHSIGLLARLDFSSKCHSDAHRRLAARIVHEWTRFSVDRGRISTRYTRSSVTYDSHDEAPSVDDGCCTANSSGCARVSVDVRVTETLH
jgi:hypothetical protein